MTRHIVKRLIRSIERLARVVGSAPTDDSPSEDSDESAVEPSQDEPAPNLPELFSATDRATVAQGLGRLVAMPSLPRETAVELVPVLLTCVEEANPSIARAGYRGLAAIVEQHPDLVVPHVRRMATGVTAYHVIVRESCVSCLVSLLERAPDRAAVVYPTLLDERDSARTAALRTLVEVAERHPVVLAPITPLLLDWLAEPGEHRLLLVRAIERVGRREPAVVQAAGPELVAWLPTTDSTVEVATVRALLAYEPTDPSAAAAFAEALAGHLSRPEPIESRRVVERLVTVGTAEHAAREAISSWVRDHPRDMGQRLLARFDEAGVGVGSAVRRDIEDMLENRRHRRD